MKYIALSIAGFDGSGGAGMQADLKTFAALGCYGMSILTALPIQNTCGVKHCYALPLQSIQDQLETIFEDITPHSIKIGMLFSSEIIECIADFLEKHANHIPIILDPVMVAKSGDNLLLPDAIDALKERLIPLSTLITPNLPEAKVLLQNIIPEQCHFENIADALLTLGSQYVLLKGGHVVGLESNDLLADQHHRHIWLKSTRIQSKNTHGTGCTLSAAIAAFLARGYSIEEAVTQAKQYLLAAIEGAIHHSIGKGQGAVHHFYAWWDI